MKKILALVLSFLAAVLLTACGAGHIAGLANGIASDAQSGAKASAAQSAPKAGASDGNVAADASDGSGDISVSSEAGNLQAGTNLSWPAEYMGDIPRLSGTITAVVTANDNSSVAYSGITEDGAAAYVASLESLGYQGYKYKDDEGIVFSGQNSDGALVTFSFSSANKEAAINYTPPME